MTGAQQHWHDVRLRQIEQQSQKRDETFLLQVMVPCADSQICIAILTVACYFTVADCLLLSAITRRPKYG